MRYYIFRYLSQTGSSYTTVFDTSPKLVEEELAAALKSFHDHEGMSQYLVYLYPLLDQNLANLKNSLAAAANIAFEEVHIFGYTSMGFQKYSLVLSECIEQGTLKIVRNRNLILQSDSTFHFINPSKKHSPFFIRTGNILERSEEINFIALQLLKYINKELTEIRCDTASILVLIYAAITLRRLFSESITVPFSTFHSYLGINSIKKGALVIISASSSGGLEDDIIEQQPDCTIVTIVLNTSNIKRGNAPGNREYLFNAKHVFNELVADSNGQDQYSLENCEYCNNNSTPVEVRTDQFIPSKVVVQDVLIRSHHVPAWLKIALNELTCRKVFFAHRNETYSEKIREIFLDIQGLLSDANVNSPFTARLKKFLKNSIPATVDLIIHAKDESSRLLAEYTHAFIAARVATELKKPITFSQLNDIKERDQISTVLVICGCVSNGNRLNAISRELRKFKNSSIHYFVGIARLPSPEETKILTSNLEARQDTKEQNKISYLYEFYLPNHNSKRFKRYQRTPWLQEKEFLEKIESTDAGFSKMIEHRLQLIDNSITGLDNELFFPNSFTNKILQLRPNFIFYNFKDQQPSQADVYLIFASILHCLRNKNQLAQKKLMTNS